MEFKGTQGKWVVTPALGTKDNGKPVFFYIEDQNQMSIAYTIQNKYNGVSEEQEIANALLISKAPEMLDMLQELRNAILSENYVQMLATSQKAKELIEEATN